jgi:hypothetical protein
MMWRQRRKRVKLIFDYRYVYPTTCPTCDESYMMCEDDGYKYSYHVICWCGAHGRVQRDDPDLLKIIEEVIEEIKNGTL